MFGKWTLPFFLLILIVYDFLKYMDVELNDYMNIANYEDRINYI